MRTGKLKLILICHTARLSGLLQMHHVNNERITMSVFMHGRDL